MTGYQIIGEQLINNIDITKSHRLIIIELKLLFSTGMHSGVVGV